MIEHMMMLVLQLGVVIFAAQAGGHLFKRLGIPVVLGELLAGAIIGPYALGAIPLPGMPEGLFPTNEAFPVSVGLYGVTTIASILLLFLVGLKTDLHLFMQFALAGSLVGVGGALVSFVLGDLTVVLFARSVFGVPMGFMDPIPLFLGVISTATSVGITARILTDNKKIDSPEGVTILSGAVIDDVLGIILLAIVVGICRSGQIEWQQIGKIAFQSVTIWLGFTVLGLVFARQIAGALKKSRDATTIAVLSLGMALVLSGIFEHAGLAMIIGAYIMGLSLSRTELANLIQDQLSPLYRLFVPVFFCVMGMLFNLRTVGSTDVLVFGLAYGFIAILAKMLGCSLPSFFLGFNWRGSLRVGLGMMPRGEVALIIAGVGLSRGIINDEAFGAAMMMNFMTLLTAPYLLDAAMRSNLPTTRKERQPKDESRHLVFAMPSAETTELVRRNIEDVFSNEGFYVHLYDLDERSYQIRKGSTIISMKADANEIIFDCPPDQSALINTIVYEVLAELEQTMRTLQSFVSRDEIGKKIFDKATNGEAPEKPLLPAEINPFAVDCDLRSETKDGVIRELVDLLVKAGEIQADKKDQALSDLFEREATMSTGMQDGIALPHAKSDAVDKLICGIGLSKEGVDFKALDGKPSKIFVMVLAPRHNPGAYLQFVAAVSRILIDENNRKKILASKSNRDLYMAFTE